METFYICTVRCADYCDGGSTGSGLDFQKLCRLFVDERQAPDENPFLLVRSSVTDVADLPSATATTFFKYLVQFVAAYIDTSPFHFLP
jgi:hypothetical protein